MHWKTKSDFSDIRGLWFCYSCVRRGNMFFTCGPNYAQSAASHGPPKVDKNGRVRDRSFTDCHDSQRFIHVPWTGPQILKYSYAQGRYFGKSGSYNKEVWKCDGKLNWQQRVIDYAESSFRPDLVHETGGEEPRKQWFFADEGTLRKILFSNKSQFFRRNNLILREDLKEIDCPTNSVYLSESDSEEKK